MSKRHKSANHDQVFQHKDVPDNFSQQWDDCEAPINSIESDVQGQDDSHTPVKANSNLAFSTYSSPSVINSGALGGLTALGTDMKLVLLCVLFVQVNLTLLMAEEDRRPSATQRSSGQPDVWNPEKPRTIFARRGLTEFQRSQAMSHLRDGAVVAGRSSPVFTLYLPTFKRAHKGRKYVNKRKDTADLGLAQTKTHLTIGNMYTALLLPKSKVKFIARASRYDLSLLSG
ncbi:hypothetical protein C0J45_4266 [Silurus meridionalis]|nr:hypothetical protein C0J45_4266 [Silurus meridionalis]